MLVNPWKGIEAKNVLFIVDASHYVEERLLRQWLEQTKADSNFDGNIQYCVVPIVDDPENIKSDDLKELFEQATLKEPLNLDTSVVPVRVVWKSQHDQHDVPKLSDLLRGNPRRPSKRKAKRILRENASQAKCIVGRPATLSDLSKRYDERRQVAVVSQDLADYVAEQASLALEVAERRLRGSRYRVPRQVSAQIRSSDGYLRGVQEIMQQTGKTEAEVRYKALPYFKELIAIPQNFWQDVAAALNRWIISLGYEKKPVVDVEKLERYRSIVREHPTAFLWTHKTHMDGFTMQSVLFENDFPPAHTMGGINMAFAGVGFLARRAGAIFIRRSFQDNPLYKLVLRKYLGFLLEKRFPLTWAFEGTRSRVGKLMPPRYGMLKYVMDAMQESNADSLYILPVAINYDMINDVKDYTAEQSGAIKRPESLSWFISYLRRMRQPLGRIYVDFGEPVVVHKNAMNDDRLALQKMAFQVGVEVNRVTPITLTSLMSLSLLGAAPRAQTIDELQSNMVVLREWAKHRNIRFTSDFDAHNQAHMLELVEVMVNAGLLKRYDEGPETVYAVGNDQHAVAGYYRNTIVHHFVPKAIAELALLEADTEPDKPLTAFWREAHRLKDMFKFEFFYAPTDEFHADINKELEFFDPDWQKNMSNADYRRNIFNTLTPLIAPASLTPYIEAYRVVADCFARLENDQTLDEKAMLSAAFKYARQAYLQRRISSKASIGQILFKNAYKLLDSYGVVEAGKSGDVDVVEKRKKISRDLRLLSHRLEWIKAQAIPNDID